MFRVNFSNIILKADISSPIYIFFPDSNWSSDNVYDSMVNYFAAIEPTFCGPTFAESDN